MPPAVAIVSHRFAPSEGPTCLLRRDSRQSNSQYLAVQKFGRKTFHCKADSSRSISFDAKFLLHLLNFLLSFQK